MAGSGLLPERIDRIPRGESTARVSRGRKAVLGAACALTILFAAACRPQSSPPPKRDNADAARHLTADQVTDLEAAAAKNPEDLESRATLLIFYARGNYPAETRRIMLWMIQRHPEGFVVWGSRHFAPGIDATLDPDGYAQGKKLWLARLVHHHIPKAELQSAASYFKLADPAISQKLLLRAEVDDADSAQLTDEFYGGLTLPPKGEKR